MAVDIAVLCTNGVKEVVLELFPAFERASGHKLAVTYGPTAGIMNKLKEGVTADAFVLTAEAIEDLVKQGKAAAGTRADLARSFIGVAVRKGAPHPDISTMEKLKQALLAAKSVAYSKLGISGLYFPTVLQRLGIEEEIKCKTVLPEGVPVGVALARGDAELGIQQISELLPVEGVEVVGPFPDGVQKVTVFSAAASAAAKEPGAARALVKFLADGFKPDKLRKWGLEPAR